MKIPTTSIPIVLVVFSVLIPSAVETTQAASPDVAEVLNVVWRQNASPTDHQSRTVYSTANDGQYYYVLQDPLAPDTTPLYRLVNGSGLDHMTSTQNNEGDYGVEATLGNVYTTQQPGTTEVTRWFDAGIGDHAIRRSGESAPGPGYIQQSLPAAGCRLRLRAVWKKF